MMVVVVDIYCCCQHERSRPWTTLYIQKVDLLGEARAKRKSSGLKIIQHQILIRFEIKMIIMMIFVVNINCFVCENFNRRSSELLLESGNSACKKMKCH